MLLALEIVEAVGNSRQRPEVMLARLLPEVPVDWERQIPAERSHGLLDTAKVGVYVASPGRPSVVSDAAIQLCLTIKVLFKLPLRQTTGMVASQLKMPGLD